MDENTLIENDVTLCLCVDEQHLKELLVSVQTWREFRPLLLALPTIVIYDREQLDRQSVDWHVKRNFQQAELHAWPHDKITYPNQRTKMLSAFVHVPPKVVTTKYFLKVDANVLVNDVKHWLDEDYFKPFDDGREPVVVAPSWSYTKLCYGSPEMFDAWADDVDELRDKPRLDIPIEPGSKRAYHKRFNSFVSFIRTDWAAWAASLAQPYGWLPVPSHDGYLSFLAERNGDSWRHYPAKRVCGFEKHKHLKNLERRAKEIIAKRFC